MEQEWHETNIRVRYSETDAMQVVYHGNYLNWFEIGRTEMMRNLGIPYRKLEEEGVMLPVIEARLFYKMPARYDDEIRIRTRLLEARVKVHFDYEIVRHADGQLLVTGYTTHAWVNKEMKPIQLRKMLPDFYQSLQAVIG